MEDSIFKNSFLSFFLQDLPELFFTHPKIIVNHMVQISMRRVVTEMEKMVTEDKKYRVFGVQIENQLQGDVESLRDELKKISEVQKVYDFTQEWNRGQASRQLNLNMNLYNETYQKI